MYQNLVKMDRMGTDNYYLMHLLIIFFVNLYIAADSQLINVYGFAFYA